MKKICITLLILIVCLTTVFANKEVYAFTNTAPVFSSREYRTEYGLFNNPAFLANSKYQLLFGLDANVFNIGNFLARANFSINDLLSYGISYLTGIPEGEGAIASAQLSTSYAKDFFAFAGFLNAGVGVNSTSIFDKTVWPLLDAGLAFGWAKTIKETEKHYIDAGLSTHIDASVASGYTATAKINTSITSIEEMITINGSSIDIPTILNAYLVSISPMFNASFDFGLKYSSNDDRYALSASITDISVSKYVALIDKSYSVDVPNAKFNVGILLQSPKAKNLHASFSADLVSINNMLEFGTKEVLTHLNLRATVDYKEKVKISAALNGGDIELGAGLDFTGNELNLIYKVNEFGDKVGQQTVDSLSLRVRIGVDKN